MNNNLVLGSTGYVGSGLTPIHLTLSHIMTKKVHHK